MNMKYAVIIIMLLCCPLYAQENELPVHLRHSDLKDMPDALNTDHDDRYLLKTLQEETQPSTPSSGVRIWLDETSGDIMAINDSGDTVIIGDF